MTPSISGAHDLGRRLLDGPDLDVYIDLGEERFAIIWQAPVEKAVSYLFNDSTDHVIVIEGDPDW